MFFAVATIVFVGVVTVVAYMFYVTPSPRDRLE